MSTKPNSNHVEQIRRALPIEVVERLNSFNYTEEQFAELDEVSIVFTTIAENLQSNENVNNGRPYCERSCLTDLQMFKRNPERLDRILDFMKAQLLISTVVDHMFYDTGRPRLLVVTPYDKSGAEQAWNRFLGAITDGKLNPNLKAYKKQILEKRWLAKRSTNLYAGSSYISITKGDRFPTFALSTNLASCSEISQVDRFIDEFLEDPADAAEIACPKCDHRFYATTRNRKASETL